MRNYSSDTENVPRHRTPFREAIVFMIGGGNYNEYLNLQAYAEVRIVPRVDCCLETE